MHLFCFLHALPHAILVCDSEGLRGRREKSVAWKIVTYPVVAGSHPTEQRRKKKIGLKLRGEKYYKCTQTE